MDRQEIRMRCLEVAQLATNKPGTPSQAAVIEWATAFEKFVVGPEDAPATTSGATARTPRLVKTPKDDASA